MLATSRVGGPGGGGGGGILPKKLLLHCQRCNLVQRALKFMGAQINMKSNRLGYCKHTTYTNRGVSLNVWGSPLKHSNFSPSPLDRTLFFIVYLLAISKYNALCVCPSPTHFAAGGHVKRTRVITRKWRSATRK